MKKRIELCTTASLLLALALVTPACSSGSGEEQYANLVECVVDHTQVEMLNETQAITVCLISHLDALNLSFTTAADCVAYVTANGGYPTSRVAACDVYIQETQGW